MAVAITRAADPASVAGSGGLITYTAASIGTAAHDRVVAVTFTAEVSGLTTVTATINYGAGDVAMSGTVLTTFGSVSAKIFYLPVGGDATTATFKFTCTGATPTASQNHITVYSVTGAQGTPTSSAGTSSTDMDASSPLSTGSTTIAASGGMLAVASCATGSTAGKTWANLTEDLELNIGSTYCHTTAKSTTAGTATRTCTGSTNQEDGVVVWIIWAPNASVERLPARVDLALSPTAITLAKELNLPQGNLALSPTAPTFSISLGSISPARVDLALSPTAPTFINTTPRDPALVDIVISSVALAQTFEKALNSVDLLLSTTAPVRAIDTIFLIPAKLDLALSETAPTAITASPGGVPRVDLVISTAAVAQTFEKDLNRVDLALTTTVPTVDPGFVNIGMDPGARDLVITGSQPAVGTHKDLNAADLVLSTTVTGLFTPLVISPATVDLVLTRTAPSLTLDIAPARVDLVLTTGAVAQTFEKDLNTVDLVLSETAPELILFTPPAEIQTPAGNAILTETAPSVDVATHDVIEIESTDLALGIATEPPELAFGFLNVVPGAGDIVLSQSPPIVVAGAVEATGRTEIDVANPGGGKRKKRYENGDDELSEGELQWMYRKIAELERAKTAKQKTVVAKELEVSLAQAAQDEDAAEVISVNLKPFSQDFGAALRDTALMTSLVGQLEDLLKRDKAERLRLADEDDVEALMLMS